MKELSATKERIFIVFANLFANKELSKITVSEISKIANINRSTFYEYFKDTYDLLDNFEDFLADIVKESTKVVHTFDGTTLDIQDIIYKPCEKFAPYITLLFSSYDSHLSLKVINSLCEYVIDLFDLDGNNPVVECATIGVITGSIGYLSHWSKLYPGLRSAPDRKQLNESLAEMSSNTLNNLIRLDRRLKGKIS